MFCDLRHISITDARKLFIKHFHTHTLCGNLSNCMKSFIIYFLFGQGMDLWFFHIYVDAWCKYHIIKIKRNNSIHNCFKNSLEFILLMVLTASSDGTGLSHSAALLHSALRLQHSIGVSTSPSVAFASGTSWMWVQQLRLARVGEMLLRAVCTPVHRLASASLPPRHSNKVIVSEDFSSCYLFALLSPDRKTTRYCLSWNLRVHPHPCVLVLLLIRIESVKSGPPISD